MNRIQAFTLLTSLLVLLLSETAEANFVKYSHPILNYDESKVAYVKLNINQKEGTLSFFSGFFLTPQSPLEITGAFIFLCSSEVNQLKKQECFQVGDLPIFVNSGLASYDTKLRWDKDNLKYIINIWHHDGSKIMTTYSNLREGEDIKGKTNDYSKFIGKKRDVLIEKGGTGILIKETKKE